MSLSFEEVLKKVEEFADRAHGDQKRKYTPERYIVHPVRVMKTCRSYTHDVCILSAALLHDVLEDTPVTKEEMKSFLLTVMNAYEAHRTLKLVEELTDVYIKKDYPQWNRLRRKQKEIERLEKTSGDSQTIKYADIIDNCNEIVAHDQDFARVFLNECKTVLRKLNKGNSMLYVQAMETVESNLQKLRTGQKENR